jgi:hypothetical protein
VEGKAKLSFSVLSIHLFLSHSFFPSCKNKKYITGSKARELQEVSTKKKCFKDFNYTYSFLAHFFLPVKTIYMKEKRRIVGYKALKNMING